MRPFLRTAILGLVGGIAALIITIISFAILEHGSAIRHAADTCFAILNAPLEALLKGTSLGRDLEKEQNFLKSMIILALWWGILGSLIAILINSVLNIVHKSWRR